MAFQPKLFEDPPKPPLEERVKEALLELVPRGEAREWAEEVRRRALERERPFLQAALPLLKEALASGKEVDPRRVETSSRRRGSLGGPGPGPSGRRPPWSSPPTWTR